MKWNESRLKEFIPLVADRVKCIRPSETGATYTYIWQAAKSEETATRAIRSAQEWGLAQGLKDQIPKRAENQPNLNQHQPERNTIMVCKSDTTWDKGSNKAGLAWILTDASGICKHRGATT
ncbi:hypothetical protein F2Q69_00037130 [Brassica cretica]|uniref:Uncharacterized protein n=1 Tax=Brassica cretica TaxID=69181 RepID=A0A8S9SPM8_BRACR|nr:hypothetical protein F2Q69_00037130 [Brassica cretica]